MKRNAQARATSEQLKEMVMALDQRDRFETACLDRSVLERVLEVLTPRQQDALLKSARSMREHFARTSTPGHSTWYPHHLQVELRLHELLSPPAGEPTRAYGDG